MSPSNEPLPQELAELIRAAGAPEAPPGLEDATLAALRTAMLPVAASAAVGAAQGSSAVQAALGKWGVATAVAALVVGSVGGAVVGRATAQATAAAEQRAAPAAPGEAPPAPPERSTPPAPPTQQAPLEPVEVQGPAPELAPTERRAPAARPPPPPTAPAQPPPLARPSEPPAAGDAIAEEERLLEMARTAMLRREPALAQAPLQEHARRFPTGQLCEERDALWVQALVAAGDRAQAASRAEAFRRQYPASLLTPMVDRALEGPK